MVKTKEPPTADAITRTFKQLDLLIARDHGDVAEMLGACHFGLGARMLRELGYSIEDLAEIVRTIEIQDQGGN